MKNLLLLSLTGAVICSSAYANTSHHLGLGVNYHLEQKSSPGYQLSYQWQFSESFEFEARYANIAEVELLEQEITTLGDYSQFSIGANFIKRYNRDLSLKAGTGLGFVSSSSNQSLIEDGSMAPYLMLAANYQFTEQVGLEFGQFTHFNSDILDTNHSLYLSLNITFGKSNRPFLPSIFNANTEPSKTVTQETTAKVQNVEDKIESASKAKVKDTPVSSTTSLPSGNWFVQLGAYHSQENAKKALKRQQGISPDLSLNIKQDQNYYRIITQGFTSKQRAEDFANMIHSQYSIAGYVKQIK